MCPSANKKKDHRHPCMQRIYIQEEKRWANNKIEKSRNLSSPVVIQGGIDTSLTSFVVRNVFIHYVDFFLNQKNICNKTFLNS